MKSPRHAVSSTPLVLLVDDAEWPTGPLDGILRQKGLVVLEARGGQQALELVGKVSPDIILINVELPDMEGDELIGRLLESPSVPRPTPILMLTSSSLGRARRLDLLRAGAWDILTHPIDPNELILRLDTLVQVKQQADRVREEGLTDPSTGLYNFRGILQRIREISADALRSDRPVTCVAFGRGRPHEGDQGTRRASRGEAAGDPVSTALREATRVSDTIGRLGEDEFVVIAPGTSGQGAQRLAERVLERLDTQAQTQDPGLTGPTLRAGFHVFEKSDPASPEDLLLRATMALHRARADTGTFRIRSYEA